MSRGVRLCAAGGLCLCLTAGCSGLIGPDYVRPDLTMPAEWKNAGRAWSGARPADDAPKRDWWEVYGDAELSELQRRARTDNFSLQIAVARLDQARAQAGMRAAALLPSLQAGVTASRTRISAERPRTNYSTQNFSTVQTDLRPVLAVAYEFDWLGKIRRDLEGAQAGAEQALAERENVALLVSAQLAATYFQLRQSDEEIALLGRTLAAQEKVRELTARRHELGAASAADLAQQGALTESTRAQLDLLRMRRKHLENALATLTGTPAAQFSLPPGNLPAAPAAVPLAAPGTLLERRPDVAAAERAVAVANAQIGVAQAAFYPSFVLAPSFIGAEATRLADLFSAPALIWSLGLAATQLLLDGGRARAGVDYASAGYRASVANYRLTVLTAIEEAQNALDDMQDLAQAEHNQAAAVAEQRKAFETSLARYRSGLENALTLAVTQQNQLAAERVLSQIRGSRYTASVALVKALGGGWQADRPAAPGRAQP